jgi:Uma2 family endonuclease
MVAWQRVATFEELYKAIEALPEGITGEVLQAGVIETMGRPGLGHRLAAGDLFVFLKGHDGRRGGGWWIESEAEIRFSQGRLAVPDLSGWRLREGEQSPPPFAADKPIARCPDWCCEVLSKSTEKKDREKKLPMYAADGVEWNWIIDAERHRIEVYRTKDGAPVPVEAIEADVECANPPFESAVRTATFWLPPDP